MFWPPSASRIPMSCFSNRRWTRAGVLFCLGLCLLLSGCGYTLNHRLKDTFRQSRGIFVPVFDNQTEQTGAEIIFTNALVRELASRHEVPLKKRDDGALELHGTLLRIDVAPTVQSDLGFQGLQSYRRLPSEIGITVVMGLILSDPKTSQVLWAKQFTGFLRVDGLLNRTFDYSAPSSVGMTTQSIVESQYPDIAQRIMRDVYDEMVEMF